MSYITENLNLVFFAILMSFRLGSFFISAPLFSDYKPPMVIKAFLPISISALIAAVVPQEVSPELYNNALLFLFAIINEVLVGTIMGFSLHLLFMLAGIAGEAAGIQVGFAIASMFDPSFGSSAILSSFMRIFLVLLFFIMNLHHTFIWAVVESYHVIPVGSQFFPIAEVVPGFLKLFNIIYIMALRFAMPVIVVILLAQIMMGIVSITAPQMNMYFNIAFSMNPLVGIFIIAMSFHMILQFFLTGTVSVNEFLRGYFITR